MLTARINKRGVLNTIRVAKSNVYKALVIKL